MAGREGAITVSDKVESGETDGPQVTVVVHPLVLLSTVDHYTRVAKDTKKRVVGVLLGTRSRGSVDVTNSFAVPFEEDAKNNSIWYLDHNYLETMYRMYKKVNAREIIVGFYSTGPKIKENDIKIDALMQDYCAQPVFVIIDVRPENDAIPTTAYVSVEEVEAEYAREREQAVAAAHPVERVERLDDDLLARRRQRPTASPSLTPAANGRCPVW